MAKPKPTTKHPAAQTHHAAKPPSKKTNSAAHHRAASSTHLVATVPAVAALPSPAVFGSAGGVRASLHGEDHSPKVNRLWHYSVLATNVSRRALSGTVESEFVFGGQVVGRESPPTHRLRNGRLDDTITFPAQAVGIPLTFQVVVHTRHGSVTLDWPVKVAR